MERKPTKTTRGPNADEKRFHAITKESDCICCGNPGPSIVDHCMGATFKHNKVIVGHWFVVPLCQSCDDITTHGSRKAFRERFGPQCDRWVAHVINTKSKPPEDVWCAIVNWAR